MPTLLQLTSRAQRASAMASLTVVSGAAGSALATSTWRGLLAHAHNANTPQTNQRSDVGLMTPSSATSAPPRATQRSRRRRTAEVSGRRAAPQPLATGLGT